MLRKFSDMVGRRIQTVDGTPGVLAGAYFDDQEWVIRYFLIDFAEAARACQIAVAAELVSALNMDHPELPIELTGPMMVLSPQADLHRPLAREEEERMVDVLNWPRYWVEGEDSEIRAVENLDGDEVRSRVDQMQAPQLRSITAIQDFTVKVKTDLDGRLHDVLVAEDGWEILYLLTFVEKEGVRQELLTSPQWIDVVDWEKREVQAGLYQKRLNPHPDDGSQRTAYAAYI